MMRVAVIQRFGRGLERPRPPVELWGMLEVTRTERTHLACLYRHDRSPPVLIVPPIHGAQVTIQGQMVHVTGIQRDGKGCHGQHWMCRTVSPGQMSVALAQAARADDPMESLYRHWWAMLNDALDVRHPPTLAGALDALGITSHDYWPFIEWVGGTGRGRVDGAGCLVVKRRDAAPPPLRGVLPPSPYIEPSPPSDPDQPFD